MPAGGTWAAQNKIRPGAYINFVYRAKNGSLTVGERGTIAVATDLPWGPDGEIIPVTSEDMLDGKSQAKVGFTAYDGDISLPLRLAFASATKALVFKSNRGGQKAKIADETTGYTIEAKYPGVVGNTITVSVEKDTPTAGDFQVNVFINIIKKESFVVKTADALSEIDSNWVKISGKSLVVTSGLTLSGGTNGTSLTDYTDFFEALKYKTFQAVAINSEDTSVATALAAWTKVQRETKGKKFVSVVLNKPDFDYEGVISVNQGFKSKNETITPVLFAIYIASLSAGACVNESLTCRLINDAVEIINPVDEDEIDKALQSGRLILTYRQDGKVVIEKDINTLHTFTDDRGYPFSKNRVMRCLDEIGNSVALKFNQNYAGKVDNNNIGRNQFKSEIVNFMDVLQNMGAIQNFEAADVTVLPGNDIDSVVVDLNIEPVDAMEKLYMTVYVSA